MKFVKNIYNARAKMKRSIYGIKAYINRMAKINEIDKNVLQVDSWGVGQRVS